MLLNDMVGIDNIKKNADDNKKDLNLKINKEFKNMSLSKTLKIDNDNISYYVDALNEVLIPAPYNVLDAVDLDDIETTLRCNVKNNPKTGYNRSTLYNQFLKLAISKIKDYYTFIHEEEYNMNQTTQNNKLNDVTTTIMNKTSIIDPKEKGEDIMNQTTTQNTSIIEELQKNGLINPDNVGAVSDLIDQLFEQEVAKKTRPRRSKTTKKGTKRIVRKTTFRPKVFINDKERELVLNVNNYDWWADLLEQEYTAGNMSKEQYNQERTALRPYKRFNKLLHKDINLTNYNWLCNNPDADVDTYYKVMIINRWYKHGYITKGLRDAFIKKLTVIYCHNTLSDNIEFLKTDTSGHPELKGWIKYEHGVFELYSWGNLIIRLDASSEIQTLQVATRTVDKLTGEHFVDFDDEHGVIDFKNIMSRSAVQHINQFNDVTGLFKGLKRSASVFNKLNKLCGIKSQEELDSYVRADNETQLITVAVSKANQQGWIQLDGAGNIKGVIN